MNGKCPKCQKDISDSYMKKDRSVGIFNDTLFCEDCDHEVIVEPNEEWDEIPIPEND